MIIEKVDGVVLNWAFMLDLVVISVVYSCLEPTRSRGHEGTKTPNDRICFNFLVSSFSPDVKLKYFSKNKSRIQLNRI
jgi:hypothetical protein